MSAVRKWLAYARRRLEYAHQLAALLAGFLVELLILLVLGPRQNSDGGVKNDVYKDADRV